MDVREIEISSPLGAALVDALAQHHGAKLAHAARVLRRLFLVASPWAPGLRFAGGIADATQLTSLVPAHPAFSLAGSGETIEDAAASCVGEAVERLSQLEQAHDACARMPRGAAAGHASARMLSLADEVISASAPHDGRDIDWTLARSLCGDRTFVPTDWCVRRAARGPLMLPGAALSTGCAAGPSFVAAAGRALLELIERDAAALWWLGGRRAQPLDPNGFAAAEATSLLERLRQGNDARSSWLLDITTDLKVPVIVTLSVDQKQRGLVCGMAARTSVAQASRAAILEMCQMELALQFVNLKQRQRGDAALNETDRRHLRLATEISADECDLLHPTGEPRIHSDSQDRTAEDVLAHLITAFTRNSIEAALVDLTRPDLDIPVVRAVAPDLQLFPCDIKAERLQHTIAACGGGHRWTAGIPLL